MTLTLIHVCRRRRPFWWRVTQCVIFGFSSLYILIPTLLSAPRRPHHQSRIRTIRSTRMLVPTTSRGRRTARSSRSAFTSHLFPPSSTCLTHNTSEMLFQTIQTAAVDIRTELYKHIVLSGGSSMYPGLPSRLEKEMKQLYLTSVLHGDPTRLNVRCPPPPNLPIPLPLIHIQTPPHDLQKFKIKIEDSPRRKHMVFLGGAVLADIMKNRQEFWVSREEWYEQGERSLEKLNRKGD
jgi:hypothetical protein